jgi:hypothetical protein
MNAIIQRMRRIAADATRRFASEDVGLQTPASQYRFARKGYDHEEEARTGVGMVRDFTQSSYERLISLYDQVTYLERYGIQGALVECGVWRGGASAMMAFANLKRGPTRRHLHLFDSFEGMPEPTIAQDGVEVLSWAGTTGDGSLKSTGVNVADPDTVHHLIVSTVGYPDEFVHIHRGWFQETLPGAREEVGPIALLRLDGDWYDSTMVTFQNLYDRVVPGGVVVIDDYGHFAGCRKATDEFLAGLHQPVYLGHIDYTGRYFIKPGT